MNNRDIKIILAGLGSMDQCKELRDSGFMSFVLRFAIDSQDGSGNQLGLAKLIKEKLPGIEVGLHVIDTKSLLHCSRMRSMELFDFLITSRGLMTDDIEQVIEIGRLRHIRGGIPVCSDDYLEWIENECFHLPQLRSEYFHFDLFPDRLSSWKELRSSSVEEGDNLEMKLVLQLLNRVTSLISLDITSANVLNILEDFPMVRGMVLNVDASVNWLTRQNCSLNEAKKIIKILLDGQFQVSKLG